MASEWKAYEFCIVEWSDCASMDELNNARVKENRADFHLDRDIVPTSKLSSDKYGVHDVDSRNVLVPWPLSSQKKPRQKGTELPAIVISVSDDRSMLVEALRAWEEGEEMDEVYTFTATKRKKKPSRKVQENEQEDKEERIANEQRNVQKKARVFRQTALSTMSASLKGKLRNRVEQTKADQKENLVKRLQQLQTDLPAIIKLLGAAEPVTNDADTVEISDTDMFEVNFDTSTKPTTFGPPPTGGVLKSNERNPAKKTSVETSDTDMLEVNFDTSTKPTTIDPPPTGGVLKSNERNPAKKTSIETSDTDMFEVNFDTSTKPTTIDPPPTGGVLKSNERNPARKTSTPKSNKKTSTVFGMVIDEDGKIPLLLETFGHTVNADDLLFMPTDCMRQTVYKLAPLIFTQDEMTNCSVSGKPSNAFPHLKPKPEIDSEKKKLLYFIVRKIYPNVSIKNKDIDKELGKKLNMVGKVKKADQDSSEQSQSEH